MRAHCAQRASSAVARDEKHFHVPDAGVQSNVVDVLLTTAPRR